MSKFDKLFHIRPDGSNRVIPLIPVLDGEGRFHIWRDVGDGIDDIQGKLVEGDYFAKDRPYSDMDVYFSFMDFLYQRSTRKDVFPILRQIRSDMHNLAASLRQIELFHTSREDRELDIRRFVTTEIEFIFTVCRSLFDLLQLVVKRSWDGIELRDKSIGKMDLADSFSKMVLQGDELRTAEQIKQRYGLPPPWAKFYQGQAPFFKLLRSYRGAVIHRGHTLDIVFITERGFAVHANYEPFSAFGVWKPETFLPNGLAPIRPVVAHVIRETLGAMGEFVRLLATTVLFPDDIAPGYRLLMRGCHIHLLAELSRYIETDVWYSQPVDAGVLSRT